MRRKTDNFLYLDAGDTVVFIKQPPGKVYYAAVREAMDLAEIPEKKLTEAFGRAWKSMPGNVDDRDRFSNHAYGETGWWQELVRHYLGFLGISPEEYIFKRIFDDIYARFDNADLWKVDEGIFQLAKLMEQSGGMGIVSNWDSRLPGLLKKLGIDQLFRHIIVSAEFGYEKPSLKIFQEAATLAGSPKNICYAGDKMELDILPAKQMGWDAYLVDPVCSSRRSATTTDGYQIVENLTELAEDIRNKIL